MEFRRKSSDLLRSTEATAGTLIQRFKAYIDTNPFIAETIRIKIDKIEYDYNECFVRQAHGGWSVICPPVDEACHIKAMYDYIDAIIQNNSNVLGFAMHYYHASGKKYYEIVQDFLNKAFKPLIDYINDSISMEMMALESEGSGNRIVQNIGNNYGAINTVSGDSNSISNSIISNALSNEIVEMAKQLLLVIDDADICDDDKEAIKDDLETLCEQLSTKAPRKPRIRKALTSIIGFVEKLGIALAVKGVTSANWQELINKLSELINGT